MTGYIMNEAQAHVTAYPHIHPHPHMSAVEDVTLTVFFLSIVLATSRVLLALLRKALRLKD